MERLFTPILPGVNVCVYCGDSEQCRDHYRPWTHFFEPYWVPACAHCNAVLGSSVQVTFGERVRKVWKKLTKTRKRLGTVADEVLEGVTGDLRQRLMWITLQARTMESRVAWGDMMASLTSSILLEGLHDSRDDLTALEDAVNLLQRCSAG